MKSPTRPNIALRRSAAVGAALALLASLLIMAGHQPAQAATQFTQPCGNPGTPAQVQHVIWIWMENESFSSVIGSAKAPYQTSLAAQCGNATNFHNESHGSLDNYIAATNGQAVPGTAFVTDCGPNTPAGQCIASNPSLFSQLDGAGASWRGYDEDMPSNCDTGNSGNYEARHNPAVYYPALSTCSQNDVPMGNSSTQTGQFYSDVQSGNLPNFSFITPNLIDDAHSSSVAAGDAWLSKTIPYITSGANYQAGNTAIFITNDEGSGADASQSENCADPALDVNQPSCHVPTVVVSPYTQAGTVDNTFYTHYSMLRTTEELLGLPLIGNAATANSMAAGFNLGPTSNAFAPPTAASGLSATAANSAQANLSWTPANPGTMPITGYQITRNGQVLTTTSSTATTYTDTSAIAGTTYVYSVAAVDNVSNLGPPSNAAAVTMPTSTNLLSNPGFETWANGLPNNWSTYSSATALSQSNDAHGGASSVSIASTSTPNYVASGVNDGSIPTINSTTAGTTYAANCWVKASKFIAIRIQLREATQHNATIGTPAVTNLAVPTLGWYQIQVLYTATGNGNRLPLSVYSPNLTAGGASFEVDDCTLAAALPSSDTTPPTAPTGLTANAVSPTQANLSWTASTDNVGVAGYQIWRGSTLIGNTSGTITSFSDTSLAANTTYTYTVTATDAAGNTSPSASPAIVTTPPVAPPSAATGLTAAATSPTQVNLGWTAATPGTYPVASYQIMRNGSVVSTTAVPATTFSDPGVAAGTNYAYTVTAVDTQGNAGAPSTAASVTTPQITNPLTNPGFENWTNGLPPGWFPYYGTTTLTQTSDAHSGSFSVKIGTTSSASTPSGVNAGSPGKPLISSTAAGATYTGTCWVKASQLVTLHIMLHEVTTSGVSAGPYKIASITVPTTTNWYQISVSNTAATSGDQMTFTVYNSTSVAGGATFEVDDCTLAQS